MEKHEPHKIPKLVCPVCGKKLADKNRCPSCRTFYPVKNGIGIFVNAKTVPDAVSREMIGEEQSFSRSFTKQVREKNVRSDAKAFYLRNSFDTFATRRFDEEGFAPLDLLAPEIMRALPDMNILIVGCGLGKDAEYLLMRGAGSVTLTDISYDFLVETKKRLTPKYAKRAKWYIQANGERMPFAPGSFDMVFMSSVLHHVPHPEKFLEHVSRLAPVVVASMESVDMGPLQPLADLVGRRVEYGNLETHRLDADRMRKKMELLGFSVRSWRGFHWFPYAALSNKLDDCFVVDGVFRTLGFMNCLAGRWGNSLTFVALRNGSGYRFC